MGLQKNTYDPHLYIGFIQDPEDPSNSPALVSLTLGLYFNDLVFFSTCDAVEAKFQQILSPLTTIDFMGVLEWFISIHFSWRLYNGDVDIHMNQSGLSQNLIKFFDLQHPSQTPNATPYRSGMPIDAIDAITAADLEDKSPAQKQRTAAY